MIRTVALLGLVGFASAFWDIFEHKPWKAGLSYKFLVFNDVPRNSTVAKENGWTTVLRATRSNSSGYDKLDLWVNPNDVTIGILADENGQTAGVQVAIPVDGLTTPVDMVEQGFTPWTYNSSVGNGVAEKYWVICAYFVSEDEETRIASYNETEVLREDYLMVEGPNGVLTAISTTLTNLDTTVWIKQACVPMMGSHYYYKMTTELSCDGPLFPWFLLFDENTKQMIGFALMTLGKINPTKFEDPPTAVVKYILETPPECLIDEVTVYGAITLHIYVNDHPSLITC